MRSCWPDSGSVRVLHSGVRGSHLDCCQYLRSQHSLVPEPALEPAAVSSEQAARFAAPVVDSEAAISVGLEACVSGSG